jgi:hypothetical protein
MEIEINNGWRIYTVKKATSGIVTPGVHIFYTEEGFPKVFKMGLDAEVAVDVAKAILKVMGVEVNHEH